LVAVGLNLAALQWVRSLARGYTENYSESNPPEPLGSDPGLTPTPDEATL